MKNIKILSLLTLICCLTFALPININASNETFSWYCMRNNNHMQPRAESNMSFIEKYNGFYVDKKHGDLEPKKRIYLTFDAGYENGNIEKILDILKIKNVRGAFFVLSNIIKSNTELVKRMADEGHLVCNHTASHRDMTKITNIEEFALELKKLEDIYCEHTGRELAKFYRPPEGKFSEQNLEFASKLGYKTIFWSFAYADWDNNRQPSIEKAKKLILDNMHNGAILLLHPTSATNANILSDIIDDLLSQGYEFGTIDEL